MDGRIPGQTRGSAHRSGHLFVRASLKCILTAGNCPHPLGPPLPRSGEGDLGRGTPPNPRQRGLAPPLHTPCRPSGRSPSARTSVRRPVASCSTAKQSNKHSCPLLWGVPQQKFPFSRAREKGIKGMRAVPGSRVWLSTRALRDRQGVFLM